MGGLQYQRGGVIAEQDGGVFATRPRALRAAGGGMRANPIPILVPCHRVISSSGALGGFAGHRDLDSPALRLKRNLLAMECSIAASLDSPPCKDLLPCA